jgi:hypothetical protein
VATVWWALLSLWFLRLMAGVPDDELLNDRKAVGTAALQRYTLWFEFHVML